MTASIPLFPPLLPGPPARHRNIFASILAADAVRGETLLSSVQKAANFVGLCIAGSEKAGTPVQEGVVFEKYLAALLSEVLKINDAIDFSLHLFYILY